MRHYIRIFRCTVCLSLAAISELRAQNTEVGLELGGYNYLGDVVRTYRIGNHSFGSRAFAREHINEGLSLRFSLGTGRVKGTDDQTFDVFSANRKAAFKAVFITSDLLFEYHFLDYRNEKIRQFWTPYLIFGLGVYNLWGQDHLSNDYTTSIRIRIPVGVGIKVRLNRRWTFGISTTVIKTNSDVIDNVSLLKPNVKNYKGGNPNNDDVMFFTGVSLSYTLYKIVCPR